MPTSGSTQNSIPYQPNFVLIVIDDLGWQDVGFMGSTYYTTPNIDKLASGGAVFTSAYSNGPNCAPTRASILTGQYAPRHGVYTVGKSERGQSRFRKLIPIKNGSGISPDITTISTVLSNSGYVTAIIGKVHGVTAIIGKVHGHGVQGFQYRFGREKKDIDDPKHVYRYTKYAKLFIEKFKDQPFFLYLAHDAVHIPLEAKKETIEKYIEKRKTGWNGNPTFAALLENLDESIGELIDTLEQFNLRRNTVIIFISDNGGHECCTSPSPLRGFKGTMYEGGIRVPLIISWPSGIKQGLKYNTPVMGIDLFPTILDIAKIQRPLNYIFDGESLLPLLRGKTDLENRALFWHFPAYLQASDHKTTGRWRSTPWGAIRMGPYKLIEIFEDGHLELYNLINDIGERNNLVSSMPEKAKELHDQLEQWRLSVSAPVPNELNPNYKLKVNTSK
jgi:arylsulfatase A-like enzyme